MLKRQAYLRKDSVVFTKVYCNERHSLQNNPGFFVSTTWIWRNFFETGNVSGTRICNIPAKRKHTSRQCNGGEVRPSLSPQRLNYGGNTTTSVESPIPSKPPSSLYKIHFYSKKRRKVFSVYKLYLCILDRLQNRLVIMKAFNIRILMKSLL